MDINKLTSKQTKEILAMLVGDAVAPQSPHVGKKCIIRTYASGVHFGELVSQSGRQVELRNARRLWRWDVAPHGISLSEVSIHGSVGSRSRICEAVAETTILDGLEIIPCTDEAAKVIESAKVYTP